MIKILVTGDFFPSKHPDEEGLVGPNNLFSDLLPVLEECDINITNLECPLFNGESPIVKVGPHLKAPTEAITILKQGGFNLLTLANNHILDHGEKGILSTIEACNREGIAFFGAGLDYSSARKPYILDIQGITIAFLGIAENEFSTTKDNNAGANGMDIVANYYDITEAKRIADYVFVIVHGGSEYYVHPLPKLRDRYRYFIDIGADVVVGHHTHCYQGYEEYQGKPIFYSLGNFLFPPLKNNVPDLWYKGYCVQFFVDSNSLEFKIIPVRQSGKFGVSRLNATENKNFERNIASLNKVIKSDKLLKENFIKYCESKTKRYSILFEPYVGRYLSFLHRKGCLPSLTFKKKRKYLLNIIKCESHQEVLTGVLEKNNFHRQGDSKN